MLCRMRSSRTSALGASCAAIVLSLGCGGCCFGAGGVLGGEVVGTVTTSDTGRPIPAARVHPYPRSYGRDGAGPAVPVWTTDHEGRYDATNVCPWGGDAIVVEADGFESQVLPAPFPSGCSHDARVVRDAALVRSPTTPP